MNFQKLLLKVEDALREEDLQNLVFLCTDLLSVKDLSTVSSVRELFGHLITKNLLSEEDTSLLLEMLTIIKQMNLIRTLGLQDQQNPPQISWFRRLLFELSEDMTEEDLKRVKFRLRYKCSQKIQGKYVTTPQLFRHLEKEDRLNENNLDILDDCLDDRPDLQRKVREHKPNMVSNIGDPQENPLLYSTQEQGSSSLSEGAAASSGASVEEQMRSLSLYQINTTTTSLPSELNVSSARFSQRSVQEVHPMLPVTEHPELEEYEMNGERRGVCVIINNHDFSSSGLSNRDGTDVDKESLEAVFCWLGFEVLTKRNCSGQRILQELRDLARRDHTGADCFVCCLLSHGGEEGIHGTDGEKVTVRELIETMSPFQCPTLLQKPKLFFIQACGGNKEQRSFPSIEQDGVSFSSDADEPEPTAEMADFLLARSTVPSYVAYRDRNKGSWFIQALCLKFKQLVPRRVDLLSILTHVNQDMSKKTDGAGRRWQMPQPEFTLTRRLVFPVPASPLL